MRNTGKRHRRGVLRYVLTGAGALALAALIFFFWPYIYARLFGHGGTVWLSEQFSKTLREKNELVVYEAEITGQETVSTQNIFNSVMQKIIMPYTFHITYSVDLSKAKVSADDDAVKLSLPSPTAHDYRLDVDQQNIQLESAEFLSIPLYDRPSAEDYEKLRSATEAKLYQEYAVNEEYLLNAWNKAEKSLLDLYQGILDSNHLTVECKIVIVRDDGLEEAQPETEQPTVTLSPVPAS